MSSAAYIVGAKRSAIGSFGGALAKLPIIDVAATVARGALEEAHVGADKIDETIFGCILQAGLGQNPARQVAISTGVPDTAPAFTVNKVCASSMKALALGAQAIALGESHLLLTGGLESMSGAPYLVPKARFGYRMGDGTLVDSMVRDGLWDVFNDYHMGITAENLADEFGISREEQDRLAHESQMKAKEAHRTSRFADEIAPVPIKTKKGPSAFERDECPRGETTQEILATLRPAFKPDGTVTAGNASTLADGAAAIVLASEDAVKAHGLAPLAKIRAAASAGVDPARMGLGVVASTRRLLERAAVALGEIELFELNEAFAVVVLAAERELGFDRARLNVNGGAVALGHPVGASGARIVVTLLKEMRRRKVSLGLASLCVGGGMGMATLVETV